ncbi:MAG: MFS transporter [Bacteroidetes bacterium]|nr:MAG: MFS transporter [Bacteroidota bacterium]
MAKTHPVRFEKDLQYYKFCAYGFLKNLRFFEPFLILFLVEKGLSYLQIGTLYAVREVVTNLFEVPSGFFADALGRRRTMLAAFAFYIVSFLVFYLGNSWMVFVLAMCFFGMGEAARTGVHKAMIFEYLTRKGWADQKVHYYGHTRSWSQKGSAVSALIAAWIVFYRGEYQTIFLFSTIPYVLDFILIASYPKFLDGERTERQTQKIGEQFAALWRSFRAAFQSAETWRAVNNLSFFSGFFKAVKDYLQPILKSLALSLPFFLWANDKERTALLIGVVYFVIYLLTSAASKAAGKTSDYFSDLHIPLNISLLSGVVLAALSGVCVWLGWDWGAVLFFLFIFMLENLRKPIGVVFFSERIKSEIMASGLSAQSQIQTIWAALSAMMLGFFIDYLGLGRGLVAVSLILVLALPFFWIRAGQTNPKKD